jgi:hypothetical protein
VGVVQLSFNSWQHSLIQFIWETPMAKRKAQGIAIGDLRTAIAKAAKATGAKGSAVIKPGIIIGLLINDEANLIEAHGLADKVTAGVANATGLTLSPALVVIKKNITVGFIDPRHTPILLE